MISCGKLLVLLIADAKETTDMEIVRNGEPLFTPSASQDTTLLDAASAGQVPPTVELWEWVTKSISHAPRRFKLEKLALLVALQIRNTMLVFAIIDAKLNTTVLVQSAGLRLLQVGLDAEWDLPRTAKPALKLFLIKLALLDKLP